LHKDSNKIYFNKLMQL